MYFILQLTNVSLVLIFLKTEINSLLYEIYLESWVIAYYASIQRVDNYTCTFLHVNITWIKFISCWDTTALLC